MSSLDSIDDAIRRDSSDLAAHTAAGDDDFSPVREQLVGGSSPYRDGRLGIERRRQSALDERRIELALMPMRLSRVFVHRVARIAAAAVAVVCAGAAWISVADPMFLRLVDMLVPRLDVDSALAGGIAMIAAAYVIGVFVGEWVLERAARRSVSASDDALADITRSGPVYEASRLASRMDPFAVALPLLAIALAVPLVGFLTALTLGHIQTAYSDLLYFGDTPGMVDRNLVYLASGAVAAGLLAIGVGLGCARQRDARGSRLNRALMHWGALISWLAIGGIVALVAARELLVVFSHAEAGPMIGVRLVLAVAGTLAVVGTAAWFALLLRRREQRLLGDA